MSEQVERNFYARCSPEQRPVALHKSPVKGETSESVSRSVSDEDAEEKLRTPDIEKGPELSSEIEEKAPEEKSRQDTTGKGKKPKYDASLLKALHNTFFWRWWIAGALKLFSGMHLD